MILNDFIIISFLGLHCTVLYDQIWFHHLLKYGFYSPRNGFLQHLRVCVEVRTCCHIMCMLVSMFDKTVKHNAHKIVRGNGDIINN